MPAFEKVCDMLKLLPSIVWLCVCVSALPAYARIGWKMPIVCACLSSVFAICATADLLRYHTHHQYVVLGKFTEQLKTTRMASFKLCFAGVCAVVALSMCAAFLVVGYSIEKGEKGTDHAYLCSYEALRENKTNACSNCASNMDANKMPVALPKGSAGLCTTAVPTGLNGTSCNATCVEIRDAFATSFEATHSLAVLCPHPPPGANTFVAFSCKADGFWMLVTSTVACIWMGAMLLTRSRSKAEGLVGFASVFLTGKKNKEVVPRT